MALFNLFSRKINKKTVKPPVNITRGNSSFSLYIKNDSTAFACIDRIASEFASLNYSVYTTKERQKVRRHSLYAVLKEPNLNDRHFNFFYQSAIDYFNGGCFWYPVFMEDSIVSLFRLPVKQVKVTWNSEQNRREYHYNGKIYRSDQIIYIPSRFDYSELTGGKSIFTAMADTFETAAGLEAFTQNSFKNGVIGKRTVIDVTQALPDITEEQSQNLKDKFQAEYSGLENAGRPLLQKKGITYSEFGTSASLDNKAAELSENRKFQETEISKLFGVPLELLNGSSSKIELENLFVLFNEFALRPMATQFQEAINSLLDEDRFYFEFDYNGIMKVSLQHRIDAYTKQINNGLLSPNEARAKENLEPIEAGDNHFMPVNLMPLNDETIHAYMAKQKNEIANGGVNPVNPTNETEQHFGGGDDKQ